MATIFYGCFRRSTKPTHLGACAPACIDSIWKQPCDRCAACGSQRECTVCGGGPLAASTLESSHERGCYCCRPACDSAATHFNRCAIACIAGTTAWDHEAHLHAPTRVP